MENNNFHKTKVENFLESLNKDTRNEDKERNNTIFGIFAMLKEVIHGALSKRDGTCGALYNELNMIVNDAVKIELSLSERYKSLDKYEVMEYREACFLLKERLHLCLYGKGNLEDLLKETSSIRTTFNKELRMKEENYWRTVESGSKRKTTYALNVNEK